MSYPPPPPPPDAGPPFQPPYQQYGGPPYQPAWGPPQTTNGTAVAVLVLAIAGWAVCFLCSPVALYLARSARRDIAASGGRQGGEGLVKAGVIIAWLNLALVGLFFVGFVVVVVISLFAGSSSSGSDVNAYLPSLLVR